MVAASTLSRVTPVFFKIKKAAGSCTLGMAISGHRTASMFNRYAIASPDDMRAALGRTQEYRAGMKSGSNVSEFPSEESGR